MIYPIFRDTVLENLVFTTGQGDCKRLVGERVGDSEISFPPFQIINTATLYIDSFFEIWGSKKIKFDFLSSLFNPPPPISPLNRPFSANVRPPTTRLDPHRRRRLVCFKQRKRH